MENLSQLTASSSSTGTLNLREKNVTNETNIRDYDIMWLGLKLNLPENLKELKTLSENQYKREISSMIYPQWGYEDSALCIFILPCATINFSQCKFYFQGVHVGVSKSNITLNFLSFAFHNSERLLGILLILSWLNKDNFIKVSP